jgi:Uma2 family endonuclease
MSATLPLRRWTRPEYDRLVECGLFATGERVELLDGLLVVREPQGGRHAMVVRMVEEALRAVFPTGWDVRSQLPIALDPDSEPEPDVSVVPGSFRDYPSAHPANPVLIVEVADTSLALDRGEKAGLYAQAGIPEFWIVDLVNARLEVHRDPARDAGGGGRYGTARMLPRSATVSPLALPHAAVAVADLLP